MNAEPLDIHDETQECLQHTDSQHGDVVAASPEPPAQTRDDGARHEGKPNEADHVVPVSQATSANCLRGEKMAEEAGTEEKNPEPDSNAATRTDDSQGRCASVCSFFHVTSMTWLSCSAFLNSGLVTTS